MSNTIRRAGTAAKFGFAALGSAILRRRSSKPPQTITSIAELETYINKVVEFGSPPSLSLAVVKYSKVVYNKSFGMADGPNRIPATPDSVYQWMSMTKMTTAVAIAQLQEQGLLNIDDSVDKYLPFFKVLYPTENSPKITIRHLLNHSSGLANPPGMLSMVHMEGELYPEQGKIARSVLANNAKLKFVPGSQGTYTNLGYTILGAIVEAVCGQPHRDYVVEHIFRPLNMMHTDFTYSHELLEHTVVGSQPIGHMLSVMLPVAFDNLDRIIRETVGGRLWLNRVYPDFTGAVGAIGPAKDAARFVMAFLNDGELDGARILSPESITLMTHEGHVAAKGGPATFYKGVVHGLGWWIWPDGERLRIMHSGDGPGFSNIMQLYPHEHLGVILMGNEWAYGVAFRGTSTRDAIANLAASLDW